MAETLEIEGDLVRIVQKNILRQMPLRDLMPHLVQKVPVTIPNLPRTAVFVHWDESNPLSQRLYILAEMPPGVRTITKRVGGQRRRYRLSFPWSYFWFVAVKEGTRAWAITNYNAYHAPKKYENITDELTVAFIPNVYAPIGNICFGSAGAPAGQSIADQIDWLVNNWYVTEFNTDLDGEMVYPFGGNSFKNWVDRTADNPACWKDFPEWKGTSRRRTSVEKLLGVDNLPRATEITAAYTIPDLPAPFTFGRAEEWLTTLRPVDRGRLKIALDNMVADNASFVETPAPVVEVLDDGGVIATE